MVVDKRFRGLSTVSAKLVYKMSYYRREKGEPSPPLSPSRDDTFGGDTTDPGKEYTS